MTLAVRLHEAIAAACPITGVRVTGASSGTFQPAPSATAQQIAAGDAALAAFDWSQAAHDAWLNLKTRSLGQAEVTAISERGKVLRAMAAVLVDEINSLRQWLVSFKAEVAAATSLANLQTRVAALPNMPDRTLAQAKTAITNKLNSGAAD